MKKLKELFKKYNHVWVLLYALIYMPWFTYLERHVTAAFYLIHSPLDDYIPFVEYFIVSEGEMWEEVLKILKQKADEGSYILQPVHVFFFSRTKKGSCRQPDLQSAV